MAIPLVLEATVPDLQQSTDRMSMLAAMLAGQDTVPDSQGGYVPATNSRVAPDGSFLPAQPNMALARGLDPSMAPSPPPAPPAASPMPQATQGAGPSAAPASDISGQAGDMEGRQGQGVSQPDSGEDATTAAYRALHDRAVQLYNQSVAQAKAQAAAGDTAGAAASWKIAEQASKHADDINDKAIEYAKPEAQPQTASPGQGILNQETGKYEVPIPAKPEKADTTIVNIGGGQWQTINNATGQPIGEPVGHPSVAPRPVTDDERTYFGLPSTGAFTIAPGEVPKQIAGAGPQVEPLDQASIDYLAQRLSLGDNAALQGLGLGKIGAENRAKVINRASAMGTASGMDAAGQASSQIANQVQLGGDKQAGRTVGALGGRISTFAEEAAQTGELALQASEAIPRTKWVPINSILQMGEAASSDPDLSRLQAANNEFATTYAKATNPSGIPTNEGREAAFKILNVAKDQEAYEASVRQLQKGIRAIQSSVGTSRANIRNSVAGQQPQGGATQAPVVPPSDVGKLAPGTQFMGTDGQLRVKH